MRIRSRQQTDTEMISRDSSYPNIVEFLVPPKEREREVALSKFSPVAEAIL